MGLYHQAGYVGRSSRCMGFVHRRQKGVMRMSKGIDFAWLAKIVLRVICVATKKGGKK